MKEQISKFNLGVALYADYLDAFLHGTKEQYELAERRYWRYMEVRQLDGAKR